MEKLTEGKIGEIGTYAVSLENKDILDAKAGVEVEGFKFGVYAGGSLKRLVMNTLRSIARKTSNTWDDALVDKVEGLLFPGPK
jgi:hypothetical protein